MTKKLTLEEAIKKFGHKYSEKYDLAGWGKTTEDGEECIFVLLRVPLPKRARLRKKFGGYKVVVAPEIAGDSVALGETANIERLVCDHGGGAVCGHCKTFLGSVPGKEPKTCPTCDRKLVESGSPPFVNPGGSDF